jgi:hypothetical protein
MHIVKKNDFKFFAFFSLRDKQLFITLFCNFHSFSEYLELNKKFKKKNYCSFLF